MIELSVTVTRALELLSAQGMSDKSLHAYTHTGFGCIVCTGKILTMEVEIGS